MCVLSIKVPIRKKSLETYYRHLVYVHACVSVEENKFGLTLIYKSGPYIEIRTQDSCLYDKLAFIQWLTSMSILVYNRLSKY